MKKFLMLVLLCFVAIVLIGSFTKKESVEWMEYEVESGDTVCDLAIRFTPNHIDYRKTEYYIIKKSNIEDALLHPGQTILVPVYE